MYYDNYENKIMNISLEDNSLSIILNDLDNLDDGTESDCGSITASHSDSSFILIK